MKRVIINEDILTELTGNILEEAFIPNMNQVCAVKEYLDNNFIKDYITDIDPNGEPIENINVSMISQRTKEPVKQFSVNELITKLDSNFSYIMKDDSDRKKLITAIVYNWLNGTITKEGLIDTNVID